ncbi:MAG: hypothetical protein AAF316_00060 [Cyanobacteria bacterium P01_A01_bin.80]
MVNLQDFLSAIAEITEAFLGLFETIEKETTEVEHALEAAIQGNLSTEQAKTAMENLTALKELIPQAIEQVNNLAPTIKSDEPDVTVDLPEEMDEVELPLVITIPVTGLPDAPAIDIEV